MGAFGVTQEARNQAIEELRQTLRLCSDEAKADARARLIESRLYDTCQGAEEWKVQIERNRQAILVKIQQRTNAATQSQYSDSTYTVPSQQQQQSVAHIAPQMGYIQHQQPIPMPVMQHNPQMYHHQPMLPAPYPPNNPQQQGWVQTPYGHQMMQSFVPPHQQQQQLPWNVVSPLSQIPSASATAATSGWGAPPPPPQPLGSQPQIMQNGYQFPPPQPRPPATTVQQKPHVLPPSEIEKQHAINEFRRLQNLARQTILSDAKDVARILRAAKVNGAQDSEKNMNLLFKAISYIELDDLSATEITPSLVSSFASSLEYTKATIQKVKAKMHEKRTAASTAAAATAATAAAARAHAESVKDPTEKLLQMLEPNSSKPSILFPSAVTSQLKHQFKEKQLVFPLPEIKISQRPTYP